MSTVLTRAFDSRFVPRLAWGSRFMWTSCPFRWQIILAVLLLALVSGLVAGVLAVFDARGRAAVETSANIQLTKQHIGERAREVQNLIGLAHFAASVSVEMRSVRHVSIRVVDMAGNVIAATPNALVAKLSHDSGGHSAPQWFINLVQPEKSQEVLEIAPSGTRLGRVIIVGEPTDEIVEAWELLEQMALLWSAVMVILAVGLYFLIGHILNPLVAFASGLHELEDGHYGFRLEAPRVRELAVIADSFNTLAAALDRANSENSDLYRQLVAVQEDERRQLSRELHDEFGPCIFGLTAGIGTLERQSGQLPGAERQAIGGCIEDLKAVTARLKSLTRSLLQRLRPVAIGRVSLGELVADLALSFQRRHPEVVIEHRVADLPATFGEAADVTIYRSIQEGLTNALRHGRPTRIGIALTIEETSEKKQVSLTIEDNGTGIPDTTPRGYGLSGMSERARSLGGQLSIEPAAPSGTILTVTIPYSTT